MILLRLVNWTATLSSKEPNATTQYDILILFIIIAIIIYLKEEEDIYYFII